MACIAHAMPMIGSMRTRNAPPLPMITSELPSVLAIHTATTMIPTK